MNNHWCNSTRQRVSLSCSCIVIKGCVVDFSERVCYQYSTFGTYRGLSVLASNSTAQVDNVPTETGIWCDLDNQPFKADCFISKHRAAKSDPIFETDHRPIFGKVSRSHSQQECRGLRTTRDDPAIAGMRGKCSVKMYRIAIPGCPRVFGNAIRSECYFRKKPIVRPNVHDP